MTVTVATRIAPDFRGQVMSLAAVLMGGVGLVLVLAAVGLYGAIAYLVIRRTREIGVRIALGATPDRVLMLVVGQGLWIAGAGIAAGLACAAVIARSAPLALYGVAPVDPGTYAAVMLLLTLTAAVAAYVPARFRLTSEESDT